MGAALAVSGADAVAQETDPDSALAYYQHGRSLLDDGDQKIPSPLGILDAVTVWEDFLGLFGRDHVSKAEKAFRRSLEFDPGFPPAAIALAELAVASREDDLLGEAAGGLAAATEHADADADVWVWRARVAALREDPEAASFAQRAAELGADRSLAFLAEARSHFALSRDSLGAIAYYSGLEDASSEGADLYYAELGPIVRPSERANWGGSEAERAEWVRNFWRKRASETGANPEERVAEHYRRIAFASEMYRRAGKRRIQMIGNDGLSGDTVLVEGRDLGLDDRGTVYLLHGEPDDVIRTSSCANPNESWLYRRPRGRLVFHFAALGSGQQFSMVSGPISACLGRATQVNAGNVDLVIEALEDRRDFDPRLGIQATRLRSTSNELANAQSSADVQRVSLALTSDLIRFESDARRDALKGLERDSYATDLGEPIPFFYDTYAFKGRGADTDLVVAFAVPGDQLPSEERAGSFLYPVQVVLAVADTVREEFFRADTARTFSSGAALGEGEHLRTALEIAVPPGESYTHTVTLRTTGQGKVGGAYGGPIEIPDFSGPDLAISDIVLGQAGDSWTRGEVSLGLVPPRRYPQGSTVTLFYELYGLDATGDPIRTSISVRPLEGGVGGFFKRLFGGGSGEIKLEFEDLVRPDESGAVQVLRTVDGRGLDPGAYRLAVEIESDGEKVRREREFIILDLDEASGP
ncbi:MAG: hypothetical protein ABFS34_03795 [Gemmatimonadota bacterium]